MWEWYLKVNQGHQKVEHINMSGTSACWSRVYLHQPMDSSTYAVSGTLWLISAVRSLTVVTDANLDTSALRS